MANIYEVEDRLSFVLVDVSHLLLYSFKRSLYMLQGGIFKLDDVIAKSVVQLVADDVSFFMNIMEVFPTPVILSLIM